MMYKWIFLSLLSFLLFCIQEELYAHLAIEEMDKVREQVKGKREWLEIHMQACQTTLKHVTAPISSIQIRAEAKVSMYRLLRICIILITGVIKFEPPPPPPK